MEGRVKSPSLPLREYLLKALFEKSLKLILRSDTTLLLNAFGFFCYGIQEASHAVLFNPSEVMIPKTLSSKYKLANILPDNS